ncbi:predicted protein [Sclerotinia sclerotiorum 1980 UF-70]|uniref:Uncharacterized protein n=1 Tax=Sclerotinia sclerotiorum (strain ATCC 18683 / 1980 / Ss-1) TaxID=665079 RepID=A7ELA0_SCLS1|nr:predicted protein [Sclerotinia sclerotiorum 1980 UF-70]EDO03616.1 predicted protein [Sclerotinia sclerotiorum 1980 UF-70]
MTVDSKTSYIALAEVLSYVERPVHMVTQRM